MPPRPENFLFFTGAFRRSELVALDVEGVQFTRDGAVLTYRGSKTNQHGKTEQKASNVSGQVTNETIMNKRINLLFR